eukprot:m.28482 g.28482  ORF g.28482 m.28482 type:complete len:113 (-) comp11860_c0_seq1:55-393(-)
MADVVAEAAPAAVSTGNDDIRKNFNFPLVVKTDMSEEMLQECQESSVTAIEKHSSNNEAAAKYLKEHMDKKFGPAWQVVVGEGFGFEMVHEAKHLMYLYVGGSVAVLVWRCS